MNSIASLFSNAAINNLQQQKADRSNIMFPVAQRPFAAVADGKVMEDPSRSIIYRTDTNQVLGVHKGRYKLQTNAECFGRFEEAIERSSLDSTGMIIADETSHGGAKCKRTYRFPYHRTETKVGDITELQIVAYNSYNGDWSFGFDLQGLRLACTNGMVLPDTIGRTRRKHTSGFDINVEIQKLNGAIKVFAQNTEQWQRWLNLPVTEVEAEAVFKVINENEKFLGDIEKDWALHKAEMGSTVWGLYNTMTFWSTHQAIRPSSRDNAPSIRLEREERVVRALNSKEFQRLVA